MQESVTATIDSETPARVSPFAVAILALTAGAVVYCAFFAGYPLNHDAAVMLQVGDVMLHGGVPYRDIIEITPPMAPAIHMAPVLISNLTDLSQPVAFHLCVTLLLAFSCWQIWSLLGLWNPAFSANRRLLFLGGWLSGSLSLQLALDYGQREHLFALVLLPWLLCRVLRSENIQPPLYTVVPLGIIAAPFILIKPFFLAVVIAIELVLLVRTRRLRTLVSPETGLLVGWGTAYFIYLVTLPRDARNELFGFLIPYLARHYGAYDGDFFEEENVFTYQWVVTVLAFAAAMVLRRSPHVRFHTLLFSLTVFFCFGAFWAQGKGWLYQQIPIRMSATALLVFVLCGQPFPAGSSWKRRLTVMMGCLIGCILLCLPPAYFLVAGQSHRVVRTGYVEFMTNKIREYTTPGDFVSFISSDVRWAYPAVIYAGVSLGSRYDLDFMIPMLYEDVKANPRQPFSYRTDSEQTDVERRYLQRRAEDVARFRPKLIAIDTDRDAQALPVGFQVSKYLELNGWHETVLAGYKPVEIACGFQFYVRND
jgi:hypothetical protein